ncbi:hypothetical protein BUY78_13065 [Staphylococcus equorum]|nr:hypothetical protein BUY78_13065 [Staphylococcus equorum]
MIVCFNNLMLKTFHFGIGIFMGLVTFALTMIFSELLIFKDKEYRKLFKIWNTLKGRKIKI